MQMMHWIAKSPWAAVLTALAATASSSQSTFSPTVGNRIESQCHDLVRKLNKFKK